MAKDTTKTSTKTSGKGFGAALGDALTGKKPAAKGTGLSRAIKSLDATKKPARASKAELKVAVKKPSKTAGRKNTLTALADATKAAKKEAGPKRHEIKNLKGLREVLDQYPKATGYTVSSLLDHEAIYLTNTRGRVVADVLLAKKPSVTKTVRK